MAAGGYTDEKQEAAPEKHPLAIALRALLRASHGPAGRSLRDAVEDSAASLHGVASSGASGDTSTAADYNQELKAQLDQGVSGSSALASELGLVWETIILARDPGETGGLCVEEVEEIVLAHLLVYREFLSPALVKGLFRRVSLGQCMLAADDRHLDVGAVMRSMAPQLHRHKETLDRIAEECCTHLMTRSESLASKLHKRLDLDGDGFVSEEEFLKAAPDAIAVELENLANSVGSESLLNDEDFADDFHMAMGAALGMTGGS